MRYKRARPNRNVHIAPQRKKYRARRTSGGFTSGFSSLGRPPWHGVLTKLKKYRWPIPVMPAMMWNQRKIAWRVVERSGNMAQAPLLVPPRADGAREGIRRSRLLTRARMRERKGS